MMKCPRDGQTMAEFEVDGIPLDYCPKCHSVWMDWGELRRVSSDLVTEYELIYRGDTDLRCPLCSKRMELADLHSVIVEECECGILFDAGEAEKVLGKSIGINDLKRIGITKDQVKNLYKKGVLKLGNYEIFVEDVD